MAWKRLRTIFSPPHGAFGRPEDFLSRLATTARHHAVMDCVSTRTPPPIVEDSASLRRYWPLLDAGLGLFSASISAARLPCSLASSNERRPIVLCTMPALFAPNIPLPPFPFFNPQATSGVTVPTLGLGIRPRGPRI